MASKIFVNLPVEDLQRSVAFFAKLGFSFNPQFTDETSTCMIVGENIFVMLMTHERFKAFAKKEIADARTQTEVLIAIDAPTREAVDTMAQAAVAAGGKIHRDPEDHGWMYLQSFEDPDGHIWEVAFMDESQLPKAQA